MKRKSKWLQIVIIIILIEILLGGAIYACKKLFIKPNNNISIEDKTVQELYEKIAHEDLDILDVMSQEAMLYYSYWNVEDPQTINCEVVQLEEDTKDYKCEGIVPFVKSSDIEEAMKDIYGPSVTVSLVSFPIDDAHYGYYDKENDGIVVFERESDKAPINLKLVDATKNDELVKLKVQVLDGVYGSVEATYQYTFEKAGKNYYLVQKEKVKE